MPGIAGIATLFVAAAALAIVVAIMPKGYVPVPGRRYGRTARLDGQLGNDARFAAVTTRPSQRAVLHMAAAQLRRTLSVRGVG